MKEKITFNDLGLSETTLRALKKKGFEEPTPIQAKCIPYLLDYDIDIIGQAKTGTGKTAAFGLPIIEKIELKRKGVKAIILTPTRELTIQVAEELNSLKGDKNINISAIYGGQSIQQQIKRLRKGVDIVVGTPGRIIDHINRNSLQLTNISFFILDEADEMLNMGFIDDIEKILKTTPSNKRSLFFSATMPDRILKLAKKYMQNYKIIKTNDKQLTVSKTNQIYFEVKNSNKFEALTRIIDIEDEFYGLVFCRTKIDVDRVSKKLIDRGYDAAGLHGDISQNRREKILNKFKNKEISILVATDVASRGIDVENLTHVINYALPQDTESYIHRIGRTGRAGQSGTAITFVTPSEYRKIIYISRITKSNIQRRSLPSSTDVLESQKKKLLKNIEEYILSNNSENKKIDAIAKELLKNHPPEKVVAALLKYQFENKLSSYDNSNNASVDDEGITRLFVAKGKKAGMTKKKLISYIKSRVKINESLFENVVVYDNFSFISVPFEYAELILQKFSSNNKSKPIIEKAKNKGKN